ncbi:sigma-70 family RNA polymerase sigma factor [bacterium]|nr:sigma-70 family RNA polymerase sigma factor [bacterium]
MDLKKIITNNQNNVKNIIRLITKEENEDIEQEVYIKVWQKSDNYEEKGKLTGWIGTIAKNFSKDYLKSSSKKMQDNSLQDDETVNSIKDKSDNPETAFIRKERQKRIVKAINSLKPKLKEVIMMYEIEGLSYEDIAYTLNCPIGTVKSRLFNAKQELAKSLEDLL